MSSLTHETNSARSRLEQVVGKARRRRNLTIGTMTTLCVVLTGYFAFAYHELAKVDASTVVEIAESQARPYLSQPASQWAEMLEERAPMVIDHAAEAALEMPAHFSARVIDYVENRARRELPVLEAQLNTHLGELLAKAEEAIEQGKGQLTTDNAEEMLTRVAEQFGEGLKGEFDQVHDRYTQVSADMLAQLDRLSKNEQLTETERLHRQLLESFLALVQRVQS